ncbi:MAG: hypothetical protein AAF289_03900 [Cyanobacteria bacterium P01_A01_bin.135]
MRKLSAAVKAVTQAILEGANYVSRAAGRIFSLSDDDYPETGSQPFEGDPSDPRKSTW